MLLDYSIPALVALLGLLHLTSFIKEYFPAKIKYREDIYDRYIDLELTKKYKGRK